MAEAEKEAVDGKELGAKLIAEAEKMRDAAAPAGARPITEDDHEHDKWYEEAEKMTPENLPAFVQKLLGEYRHSYGTICHAVAAAGLAGAHAIDNSKQGGITYFQAGCILWEFVIRWMRWQDKPMRLVDMDDLLYPQYKSKFTTISKKTWEDVQRKARVKLDKDGKGTHPDCDKKRIKHIGKQLEGLAKEFGKEARGER